MTSMFKTVTMLDKYVDRYVCIINSHLVTIVACLILVKIWIKCCQNFIYSEFEKYI
jgi:hypothetical protein